MIKLIPTDKKKEFYVDSNFPFIGYLNESDKRKKVNSTKYLKLSTFSNSKSYIGLKEIETCYVLIPEYYNISDCVLNMSGCIDDSHYPLFAPNVLSRNIDVNKNLKELIELIDSSGKSGTMYTRNPSTKIKIVYPEKKNNDLVEVEVKYIELKTLFYTIGNVNLRYNVCFGY
jgi:hypothetical protein